MTCRNRSLCVIPTGSPASVPSHGGKCVFIHPSPIIHFFPLFQMLAFFTHTKNNNSACLHSSVYFNCTISCHFPMGVMQAFLQDPSKAFSEGNRSAQKTKSFSSLSTLLSLRTNQMMCHFAVTVASETQRVSPQKKKNHKCIKFV